MATRALWTVVFILVLSSFVSCVTINNLERKIDLDDYNVEITLNVELTNDGKEDLTSIELPVKQYGIGRVAWVDGTDCKAYLSSKKTDAAGIDYFTARFAAVKPGQSTKFTVRAVISQAIVAFPETIAQNERQYVVYKDWQTIKLPYAVSKQSTIVTLPSEAVLIPEEDQDVVKQDKETLTYGPFGLKEGDKELKLHYEYNGPMIHINKLNKDIYVSHWSGVTFEETYDMKSEGAALKEGFSRFELQRNPYHSGASAVRMMHRNLPTGAFDVYYRDEIGNISTSHVRPEVDSVNLELTPRFPMFGQWKNNFYMGYTLPLGSAVRSENGKYVLKFSLGSSFDSSVVDKQIISVILPEGASDIEVKPPMNKLMSTVQHGITYQMLDVTGSPYVRFEVENVVPEGFNVLMVEVSYKYNSMRMLTAPAIVTVTLLAIIAGMYFVMRKH